MTRSKTTAAQTRRKRIQPNENCEPSIDTFNRLTFQEAELLRFLHLGYVGLLLSDKQTLRALESKDLANCVMGVWRTTALGRAHVENLKCTSSAPRVRPQRRFAVTNVLGR